MAIRVKKLAREVRGSSQQVIALLEELGYARYRSDMDMVADVPADKVRKAAKRGELPVIKSATQGAASPPPPAAPTPSKAAAKRPPDLMAQLVPGVVPVGAPAPASPLDVSLDTLADAAPTGARRVDVEKVISEAGDSLRSEAQRLHAQSRDLAARTAALQAENERIQAESDRLEGERVRLQVEIDGMRQELETRAATLDAVEAGGVPLGRLLETRGLRGTDEQNRALEALARARLLAPLLDRLRVIDPGPVRTLLRDKLVLTGGDVSGLEGLAAVQVPAERAEVPGEAALAQVRNDLAGELLLSGFTRARIVGSDAVALRLLRGRIDPRVTLDIVPGRSRDARQAARDLEGVDVLVLWQVDEDDAARATFDASDVAVVRVTSAGLHALVADVREALHAL